MSNGHFFRLAVIDLGTNSVRFDVHEIGPKKRTKLLHREKLMVRLGENVFISGKLDGKAIRRTLQAFISFHKTCEELRVNKTIAFATSALREATDSDELVKSIRVSTGIDLRIIPGEEEARLIAQGILAHQRNLKGCFALVDIGGGSTEISVCDNGTILYSESFPLGAARLQQVYLRTSPPPKKSGDGTWGLTPMRSHIRRVLMEKVAGPPWPRIEYIVGSSGTIKAIARMLRKSGGSKSFSLAQLKKAAKKLSQLTAEELRRVPGLEPKRADLIVAGTTLLEECMEALEVRRVVPTLYSLRDGILQRELATIDPTPSMHKMKETELMQLLDRAQKFGVNLKHARRLLVTAETLFDRLRPIHRLDSTWKRLLLFAAIFRDTGRAISPVHHEVHSHYIVQHTDINGFEPWEKDFVAELVLRHEGKKLEFEELPFKGDRMEPARKAFPKLLALLRIIDALDPAHHSVLTNRQISLRQSKVQIRLQRGHWVELAVLRLQQKKALFEKIFERPLTAESM